MTLPLALLAWLAFCTLPSLVAIIVLLILAPEGFQDDDGFHLFDDWEA